jgi:putative IMPACT (imprinted ancient) family translation regulator
MWMWMDTCGKMSNDKDRQQDELDALIAFYGDNGVTVNGNDSWRIKIASGVELEIVVPTEYPSQEAPIPRLHAPSFVLAPTRRKELEEELVAMYQNDLEVAILWTEHLRDVLGDVDLSQRQQQQPQEDGQELDPDTACAEELGETGTRIFHPASSKYGQTIRHFQESIIQDESNRRTIYRGSPYHPPKSGPAETMIAHVASVETMDHVNWVLAELLFNDKKVAKATHNMIAYRFWDAKRECWVSDNDDDGEKGAGAKLAALLEMANVTNVIVVVSRWFGGIHLGPSRFKYFASVARDALEESGFINDKNK